MGCKHVTSACTRRLMSMFPYDLFVLIIGRNTERAIDTFHSLLLIKKLWQMQILEVSICSWKKERRWFIKHAYFFGSAGYIYIWNNYFCSLGPMEYTFLLLFIIKRKWATWWQSELTMAGGMLSNEQQILLFSTTCILTWGTSSIFPHGYQVDIISIFTTIRNMLILAQL